MYIKSDDIAFLDNYFYKKFGKFPYIIFQETKYGDRFCLMLNEENNLSKIKYYKMGLSPSVISAKGYIDCLLRVPNNALVFETQADKRKYVLEKSQDEMKQLYEKEQHENNL